MQLKELKREIEDLPNLDDNLKSFQENWLSPFLTNNGNFNIDEKGSHHKVLKKLSSEEQQELNLKLKTFYKMFDSLKYGQFTNNKMHAIGKALIELKLMSFQAQSYPTSLQNSSHIGSKYNYVTSKIISDEFSGIRPVINEIKEFDFNLQRLEEIYQEINQYLYDKLPLEHSILIMDKPHGKHFKGLKDVSNRRKRLIKQLGINFISLQNEMRKRPSSYTEKNLNLTHI